MYLKNRKKSLIVKLSKRFLLNIRKKICIKFNIFLLKDLQNLKYEYK